MHDVLIAILAAGASRRLGQPKQLVLVENEPLLRRQCRVALEADIGPVTVILGYEADQIAQALDGLPAQLLTNSNWSEGIASSIRMAATAGQQAQSKAVLLLLADQYRITAQDLLKLYHAWQASLRRKVCRSIFQSYKGPPVLLPDNFFEAALRLVGDEGARKLISSLDADSRVEVEITNAPFDLDTVDQLNLLQDK